RPGHREDPWLVREAQPYSGTRAHRDEAHGLHATAGGGEEERRHCQYVHRPTFRIRDSPKFGRTRWMSATRRSAPCPRNSAGVSVLVEETLSKSVSSRHISNPLISRTSSRSHRPGSVSGTLHAKVGAGGQARMKSAPGAMPQLRTPSTRMAKIDRLGWAAGLSFNAYGVRVGVRVNQPDVLGRVSTLLPPGWKPVESSIVDQIYSLWL